MSFRSTLITAMTSLVLAAALGACGGSKPQTTSQPASTSSIVSAAATPTSTGASTKQVKTPVPSGSKKSSTHPIRKAKLRATIYNPKPPSRTSTSTAPLSPPSAQNPCTFVSRSEAEAALQAPIAQEIKAPLGPTCVILAQGQKQSVSVAVQLLDVAARLAHMKKKPRQFTVAGRTTYCGTLGTSMLFVELPGGRALQIAGAPCAQATALATRAIGRIKG